MCSHIWRVMWTYFRYSWHFLLFVKNMCPRTLQQHSKNKRKSETCPQSPLILILTGHNSWLTDTLNSVFQNFPFRFCLALAILLWVPYGRRLETHHTVRAVGKARASRDVQPQDPEAKQLSPRSCTEVQSTRCKSTTQLCLEWKGKSKYRAFHLEL